MRTQQLAATALLAATLILNSNLPSAPATGGRAAASASPIVIGQLVPLTGAYAAGTAPYEQAGAKLALAEINAQGGINGRPLQLVQADDQSTPGGAIAAFTRLTQTGHVSALIGPVASVQLQAMTPAVKRAGLPMMIGGGGGHSDPRRQPLGLSHPVQQHLLGQGAHRLRRPHAAPDADRHHPLDGPLQYGARGRAAR